MKINKKIKINKINKVNNLKKLSMMSQFDLIVEFLKALGINTDDLTLAEIASIRYGMFKAIDTECKVQLISPTDREQYINM